MNISIRELRLSSIWLKTLAGETAITNLEEEASFKGEFEKARSRSFFSVWNPPWRFGREQSFWEYYIGKHSDSPKRIANRLIDKHKAWENLLPLRLRSPGKIMAVKQPGWLRTCSVYVEGYVYPHSIAVVVNVTVHQDNGALVSIEEWVNRTIALRQQGRWFEAAWVQRRTPAQMTMLEVASELFTRLKRLAFGDGDVEWVVDGYANPFTIATIIDASGADPFTKPEAVETKDSGWLYRVLDGLSSGSPDWPSRDPFGSTLGIKPRPPFPPPPPGHLLRAAGTGRAIWFPNYFSDHLKGPERHRPVLSSYHRHLTLLSMQVESLITLLQRNQGFLKHFGELPAHFLDRTRWACQTLGQLYGARRTYQSFSAMEQIRTREKLVNRIRKDLGMKELYKRS